MDKLFYNNGDVCMKIPRCEYIPAYNRLVKKIYNYIPSWTIQGKKTTKSLRWIGQHISSPQNRLILGATALMSQPFIDLYNKRVDEETRKVSAARTVAKIIAGTLTGFTVRYLCILAVDKMTKPLNTKRLKNRKLQTFFTPKKLPHSMLKYKQALGTIISLAVMTVTNILIDAPLTQYLTNKFVHNEKEYEKFKEFQKNLIKNNQIMGGKNA